MKVACALLRETCGCVGWLVILLGGDGGQAVEHWILLFL